LLASGIWDETELNFRKVITADVKVAMGTDSGMPDILFGEHSRELEYMVRWGMTNAQALAAGTINAAKTVGADKMIGTLEPGKHADLLVLGKNPLEDISSIRQSLEAVMLDGAFMK
jgi:imidazolonepropionase-like amidohydrolase